MSGILGAQQDEDQARYPMKFVFVVIGVNRLPEKASAGRADLTVDKITKILTIRTDKDHGHEKKSTSM